MLLFNLERVVDLLGCRFGSNSVEQPVSVQWGKFVSSMQSGVDFKAVSDIRKVYNPVSILKPKRWYETSDYIPADKFTNFIIKDEGGNFTLRCFYQTTDRIDTESAAPEKQVLLVKVEVAKDGSRTFLFVGTELLSSDLQLRGKTDVILKDARGSLVYMISQVYRDKIMAVRSRQIKAGPED